MFRDGTFLWRNDKILPVGSSEGALRASRGSVLYYVIGRDLTDNNAQKLFLVNSLTGEILARIATAGFCETCGVAVAPDGTIYLNDLLSTRIFEIR